MANRTGLGSMAPLAHAAPGRGAHAGLVEQDQQRLALDARAGAGADGPGSLGVRRLRSRRHREWRCVSRRGQVVAPAPDAGRARPGRADDAAATATPRPTIPATLWVPLRSSRS